MYKQIKQSKKRFKEETQGDDEDEKDSKNPWGELSECWGLNDSVEDDFGTSRNGEPKDQGRSIKERLGVKQPQRELIQTKEEHVSSGSESEEEWCKKSKVLRMRMHADDEEEKIHKRRAKLQQVSGIIDSQHDE